MHRLHIIAIAASGALFTSAWFWLHWGKTASARDSRAAAAATFQAPNSEAAATMAAHPLESAAGGGVAASPELDRGAADEMRERLRRLLASMPAGGPLAEDAPAEAGVGPLSASGRSLAPMPKGTGPIDGGGVTALTQYIQDRMREDFFPLAGQCYRRELAKSPGLTGDVVLDYRIVGDDRVGGVVDDASIDEQGSTLKSSAFDQCLTESMMSVRFGAPPDGDHATTARLSIHFSPPPPSH